MTQNPTTLPVIDAASVDAAISTRMSARAFLPKPVPRATIEHLLTLASRAPSGTNTQPWKVYVLGGAVRDAVGPEVALRLDFNGSLRTEVASDVLAELAGFDIEYAEQPISPSAGAEALARLRWTGTVPIAAAAEEPLAGIGAVPWRVAPAPWEGSAARITT